MNCHGTLGRRISKAMIHSGLDVLMSHRKSLLAGKNIGLVANPSSINRDYRFIVDLFQSEKAWEMKALYGPEHGLRGEMQDQESCPSYRDPHSGLPVYSLYGENLKPSAEMLQEIDALVFDIQDIGSRYYTFIYTLSYLMESCRENHLELCVLDRPNPISGEDVEGPVLEAGYESFVGRFPLPIRHGMTIGELALLFHKEFGIDCTLEVVKMEGWRRDTFFEVSGLPWVLPSPNMPTVETAIVYPGMCLLEGTNVSEGRGTTRPFEIFGAPWIDPYRLCKTMESFQLKGVRLRPLYFKPTFHKHAGKTCGGAQIHVTDRKVFRPVRTALCLLFVLRTEFANDFRWKDPPYEFVTDRLPIDVLWGTAWIREDLDKGTDPERIEEKWKDGLEEFKRKRKKYILYD